MSESENQTVTTGTIENLTVDLCSLAFARTKDSELLQIRTGNDDEWRFPRRVQKLVITIEPRKDPTYVMTQVDF